jgi:uncharacterized membrane protein YgcG
MPVLIIVVAVALLMVAGLIALRLATRSSKVYNGPDLTLYELARLAGGRYRVLNTALAALAAGEMIQARRDGMLTRTATASEEIVHPVEAEILALLEARQDGVMVWDVKAEVVLRGAGVAALAERLRELKMIEDEDLRMVPTRLGQAALAHYRLRHREEKILPSRSGDHLPGKESSLFGIALYGLHQMRDQEMAKVFTLSGAVPPPPPGWDETPRRPRRGKKGGSSRGGSSGPGDSSSSPLPREAHWYSAGSNWSSGDSGGSSCGSGY